MLKLEENPKEYDGRTMAEQLMEDGAVTIREKVASAIFRSLAVLFTLT